MAFPLSWDGATLTWGATGSYLNIYKGGSPTAFMNTGGSNSETMNVDYISCWQKR